MSRPWVENEDGPDCSCGDPTVVKTTEAGAILLCLFHTGPEGAYLRLPDQAPDDWSGLSIDQVRGLAVA